MNVGIFIPIGNNGWLLSENAPQYKPSFELNKQITLKAEHYGVDFALSMIKLRGFGGKTEFWDHNLESFTLMAGLAAVTSRIKLFATAASLVMPPAIVARMSSTIDSISNGRFGLNLVTGWQRPEYSQMGMWPGDQFFGTRYQYLSEYIQVLRDLWGTGRSDFKGEHFQMDHCRMSPQPQADMMVICAAVMTAFTSRDTASIGPRAPSRCGTLAPSMPIRRSAPPTIRLSGAATAEPSRPTSMASTQAMIAMPSSGQNAFPPVMAKAGFNTILCSSNVLGTTRLRRTASQVAKAIRASVIRTTANHSAGAVMASVASRLRTMTPTKVTPNMASDTIRLAPRTRNSSLPSRRYPNRRGSGRMTARAMAVLITALNSRPSGAAQAMMTP